MIIWKKSYKKNGKMHGVDIVLCNISEISKLDSGNIMRKAMNFQKEAFKKMFVVITLKMRELVL